MDRDLTEDRPSVLLTHVWVFLTKCLHNIVAKFSLNSFIPNLNDYFLNKETHQLLTPVGDVWKEIHTNMQTSLR